MVTAINPQHTDPKAIREYAEQFAMHPARMTCIEDFLDRDLAVKLHRFLTEEAEFYQEFGVYSVDGPVDEATFLNAEDGDRFFRMSKLAGTKPEHRLSPNALAYLSLRSALNDDAFISFFEQISGMRLRSTEDVGVHSMTTGDFLRPHSDANKDRRLAFVIYLSLDWSEEFGGVLEVLDRDEKLTRVVPEFNKVIAFDVLADSKHLITPIRDPAGTTTRVTIGGWYSGPERAAEQGA
jgi:Rps23 Pro-64 3,4-dihydroxylase Tpa1-like proline 4-hydroxylase